ncbi:DUF3727 domain-containing protein [Pseudanabaena sp. FACHB-2040]|uniref:DUF3727 domain-containing protein n=1 Tax=Pseudanabaena sp. FACHB-2040 TaxID=2692859 RepID=UPI00168997A6|nr:DUF3727 domain-containing protein [Pseudanabaena sp. FACHB-2040]MBD2260431.1 DUF3727 domain-containing protein [Pseudanabaena sp. FACHB-2040]
MADEDNLQHDEPTVLLTDDQGLTLPCVVEQTFDLGEREYLLLLPVNAPIEIFVWRADEGDEEEVLMDVEDHEVDAIFPTAKAVLGEQNLVLLRTAITLSAEGELPEPEEDDCLTLELDELSVGEEDATEEFQILATFFYEDEEYTLCTPLDPLLIFAHRNDKGDLEVVSPEEFQQIRSSLEEKLFDMLE